MCGYTWQTLLVHRVRSRKTEEVHGSWLTDLHGVTLLNGGSQRGVLDHGHPSLPLSCACLLPRVGDYVASFLGGWLMPRSCTKLHHLQTEFSHCKTTRSVPEFLYKDHVFLSFIEESLSVPSYCIRTTKCLHWEFQK